MSLCQQDGGLGGGNAAPPKGSRDLELSLSPLRCTLTARLAFPPPFLQEAAALALSSTALFLFFSSPSSLRAGMGWWLLVVGLLLCVLLRFALRSSTPPFALHALHGRTAVVTGEHGGSAWHCPTAGCSLLSVVLCSAGGSSGIGEAVARELARCGARVVLATRDALRGEEAAWRIRRVRAGEG